MELHRDFPMGLTSICFGFDDFSGLKFFHRFGIHLLEIEPLNQAWTPGDPKSTADLLSLCEKYDVKPNSIHGYFIKDKGDSVVDEDPDIRKNAIQRNLTLLGGARDIGARYVVMHLYSPNWERTDEERLELAKRALEAMLPEAEKTGIAVAIENLGIDWSIKHINQLLDELNHPLLGICLDVGHSAMYGDVADELELCGSRLTGLHIHDYDPDLSDHIIPFRGKVDWNGFISALKRINYQGPLMFETMVRREEEPVDSFIAEARAAYEALGEMLLG